MKKTTILLAVLASLVFALPPAQAKHLPQNYCSETGDVCQSTKRVDGVRKLKITLYSKYFDRYKLCVKAPDDATTCKGFKIQEMGEQFGDTVRWSKHFPNVGDGAYTVTWKSGGQRVGRKLGFHV